VMTPEPELVGTTDFRRGQKTLSPRIGSNPGFGWGSSLFSKGIEKGGESDEKSITAIGAPGFST
jgi:hypothetical protein